ncbi:MAG TPA: hypothetical protein VGA37_07120 [Gemmatimonadales bacterium]
MKDGLDSLGRVRLQGVALVAIAFAAGVLAGFAGERVRATRARPALERAPWERGAFRQRSPRGGIPGFYEQLGLSDDQRAQIHRIVEANQPRTEAVIAQSMPLILATMDSVRLEIREVLTPAQRARLDSITPPIRHRRMGPGGLPGPFPGPPPPRPDGP